MAKKPKVSAKGLESFIKRTVPLEKESKYTIHQGYH